MSATGGALRGLVVAFGITFLAPAAHAARLPDWAQAIASSAPALPAELGKDSARILLIDTAVKINPDGSVRRTYRSARQILFLRPGDSGVAIDRTFVSDESAKFRTSRAWHLPPGEKAEKGSKSAQIEIGGSWGSFLSDNRQRVVAIDGVRGGSLVFFEFEADEYPHALGFNVWFGAGVEVVRERFSIDLPPGFTLRSAWLRKDGSPPVTVGTTTTWELRDIPAPDDSDLAVDADDTRPHLVVGVIAPPAITRPASFENWAALGRWYDGLANEKYLPTPEITAAAQGLVPAGTPPAETIRAAARYVRDRVRYVARSVGIGGYIPHSAAEVFSSLHGDCKDKAALLRTLLAARGIESYPLMIHASSKDTVSSEVPTLTSFDHVVLAVKLPEDAVAALPAPAITDDPDLGKLLIVDPTSAETAIGEIPHYLSAHIGFAAAGAKSKLVKVPAAAPDVHRVTRTIAIKVTPGYPVTYGVTVRRAGAFAANARGRWRSSAKDERTSIEEDIRRRFNGATVKDVAVEEEAADGTLVETLSWTASTLAPGEALS